MSAATDHSLPDGGVTAVSAELPSDRGLRFVAVRADLMPAEITRARAAEQMRSRVLIGLAAVAALLVLFYGFSWWQTHSARNDLSAAQSHGVELNAQTAKYAPLVEAQQRTASIDAQLAQLMTGDLSWRTMLTTLRSKAPAGTTLTQVTGSVSTDSATTSTTTGGFSLNDTGPAQAGTLTLTGTARDKTSVATYADRLAAVPGLTAPTPTSVTSGSGGTGGGSGVTFTMNVTINSKALGGRYATAPATATTGVAGSTTGGN
ncbi:PilN domain-containing protein [Jatrophihabitans endophyticus]|uniref:PilN domain-containing protein n=1 Tax=Jatrophihabitans endophyticus TaxID=1206085 RepID=UPI0019D99189|nr:PilN domain-containing protein [Jatrophihabitans endophyticus]MBE7189357.1 PilN domain-containing protein [Jatrophihabitans endophyticus]